MTISTVWVPYPETLTIIGTKATTGMDRMSKAAGVNRPLKTGAVQDKQAVAKKIAEHRKNNKENRVNSEETIVKVVREETLLF